MGHAGVHGNKLADGLTGHFEIQGRLIMDKEDIVKAVFRLGTFRAHIFFPTGSYVFFPSRLTCAFFPFQAHMFFSL